MAQTVNSAFLEFNQDTVNLFPARTKSARSSRDWLITQLEKLPEKIQDFPDLYEGKHIKFGSFARNTKIKPLDDIDLILTFSASQSTYLTISYGKSYFLNVPETATKLRKLCNDDGTLNSIKVVNKLVKSLSEIEHYKKAEIHRKQEAATVQLNSYEWNFDIVPAFYTDKEYFLIPDGIGGWKATDPRVDQARVSEINQKHGGRILQVIRTLKYWNQRPTMPSLGSYLLENLVLNYFNGESKVSEYIDINLINFWHHLASAIYGTVQDPKGFQDELNGLSYDDKNKIASKAKEVHAKAYTAYKAETEEKNHEKAIRLWGEIFGGEFPKYG
jgi:hypothetical protein